MSGLGRRVPSDWEHVSKYPLRAVQPETVQTVERILYRPTKPWREFYNQGQEGACVGFGSSEMMSILNHRRYDARWLWNEAKKIDEWPDTNPGDDNGTSVRAAMDVLRTEGHIREGRTDFQNKMPNLAGWFVPHLVLAGCSLVLVLIAARAFKRSRDVLS